VKPSRDIARLIEIMAALRTPGSGCPWDLEQTFKTIAPYTIEEAYEVADVIARDDLGCLKDELGDLLLQVAFHARMAEEQGAFDFADVVEAITTKLIRRHPHVFADADGRTAEAVEGLWERIKADEKAARGDAEPGGALAGVPGQICTNPEAMSCEPTHWLNWPMESTSPPCLCRNDGVQGSSKAWSRTFRSGPNAHSALSPMRRRSDRRLAPMGSNRYSTRSRLTSAAMGISATGRSGILARMPFARVTTPLTPAAMSSARS